MIQPVTADNPAASLAAPAPGPLFTVLVVNYNSSAFIRQGLVALEMLSSHEYEVLICDNGSEPEDLFRLRRAASFHANVHLLLRQQSAFGSVGHGEALNYLAGFVRTPYMAVMDADCLPLMPGWDRFLIDRIDAKTKIAGTPVAPNGTNSVKPTDFPLMFLCMIETASFRRLGIDFRPRDIKSGQDTGWELRAKFLAAGYAGFNLFGLNTRGFKEGPFGECVCDEYYTDASRAALFCSHLGRGSSPRSGKYGRGPFSFAGRAYLRDRELWLRTFRRLLRKACGEAEAPHCPACGADRPRPFPRSLPDAETGAAPAFLCGSCGSVFPSGAVSNARAGCRLEKNEERGRAGVRATRSLETAPRPDQLIAEAAGLLPVGGMLGFETRILGDRNPGLSARLAGPGPYYALLTLAAVDRLLEGKGFKRVRTAVIANGFADALPKAISKRPLLKSLAVRAFRLLPGIFPDRYSIVAEKVA